MNKDRLLEKPFQVFLAIFYFTLCLGTFILERNDNIYNAYFFFVFFLLALYGQSRTLNYKYLTGGGEKIWDKHAKKGLFFSGKSFEVKSNEQFYFERYTSVKNLKIDSIRRFFSYGMIASYFLVLYFSGSLSHSFLNIIPFLVCLTIVKTTYLGHYLIPLLLNILGVGYAYTQYDLHLDFFTVFYIFFIFTLLILYRKIEQQQVHHGSTYFETSHPWDRGEKRQIVKTAVVFTTLLLGLLVLFLYLTPAQWGNSSERISEYTQIKTQRIAKWAIKYIIRPTWLKRDMSDTGAPLKEFDKGQGEKIASGEKGDDKTKSKSLKFGTEEGRLFPLGDESGQKNKTGLKIKESKDSSNDSGKPPKQTQADQKGESRRLDDQSKNETSQGNAPNGGGQGDKPQDEKKEKEGNGGSSAPDPNQGAAPTPTQAPGTGLGTDPSQGNSQGNQPQNQQEKPEKQDKPQGLADKPTQGGDQSLKPKDKGSAESEGKNKGNPGKEKGNPKGSNGGGKGTQGSKGESSGGSGGSSSQNDSKDDKSKDNTKQDDQNNDQGQDQGQKDQPQENSDQQSSQSQQEQDNDPPWWYWLILALILLLLAAGIYYYFKKRKGVRQVDFASPLREDLRHDWDRIRTLNLTPEEEIITRYNFFQKVSHHLLPGESIKLPPSLYSQLVIEQFPRIKKQVEYITQAFSDVYYGDEPANAEILKHYRLQIKQIFEFFRF